MPWCHGACVLDVGNKFVGTGNNEENISRTCGKCASAIVPAFWMWVGNFPGYGRQKKRISQEYSGNVPVPWCLRFGCVGEDFVGTRHNEHNICSICGKRALAMVPAF